MRIKHEPNTRAGKICAGASASPASAHTLTRRRTRSGALTHKQATTAPPPLRARIDNRPALARPGLTLAQARSHFTARIHAPAPARAHSQARRALLPAVAVRAAYAASAGVQTRAHTQRRNARKGAKRKANG